MLNENVVLPEFVPPWWKDSAAMKAEYERKKRMEGTISEIKRKLDLRGVMHVEAERLKSSKQQRTEEKERRRTLLEQRKANAVAENERPETPPTISREPLVCCMS